MSPQPEGALLRAAPGLVVEPWATNIGGARWLAVAPNGDVFLTDHERGAVVVLAGSDAQGRVLSRGTYASGLRAPFGLAFHPAGWLYVANTDAVLRFRYRPGDREATAPPERVLELPGHGYNQHWTRNVAFSSDYRSLYVTVGSETNVDPEPDPRRAALTVCDLDGGHARVFASGLRNPVGLAVRPGTEELFTVVNERDELGDDLPPDYLTRVREGGFYGWPYAYWGRHEDPRRRGERPDLVARALEPDLSLGAHSAPLGLLFYTGVMLPPEYRGDALVSLHGSWNRAEPAGYRVVRARFAGGRPTGAVEDFLSGWLLPDGRVWGRPAGLAQAPDGSVLVVDDGSRTVWRVRRQGAPRDGGA